VRKTSDVKIAAVVPEVAGSQSKTARGAKAKPKTQHNKPASKRRPL
jgi:hypothetical protein